MTKTIKLFAVLFVMVVFASCGGGSSSSDSTENGENAKLTGTVKIDGSSTVYPITEAVAEEFRIDQPDVRVTIGVSGTGGGFKKFSRGESDINDASRPIKDKEIKVCEENMIKYVELTVAYDGLAVLINKENDWVDHFTVEELKKIWEPSAQETITSWNQIRPEWPDVPFSLYGPGVASGTYDYFTEVIVGESGASRGDYTASEDDNVLVQGIAGDKNSIGFFGLAYYEENKDKLKLVGVDNGTGAILPTTETVKTGEYAPLSRPIFIYVSDAGAKQESVNEFVNFYMQNAAELVPDIGYIALPEQEYGAQIAKYAAFKASAVK